EVEDAEFRDERGQGRADVLGDGHERDRLARPAGTRAGGANAILHGGRAAGQEVAEGGGGGGGADGLIASGFLRYHPLFSIPHSRSGRVPRWPTFVPFALSAMTWAALDRSPTLSRPPTT